MGRSTTGPVYCLIPGLPAEQVRLSSMSLETLAEKIHTWGQELGFQEVGITDTDLVEHEQHLKRWLASNYHGDMAYMARHGDKRSRPAELLPGTLRVITARMDYLTDSNTPLDNTDRAYVARYALGRDYHKVLRSRLKQLLARIEDYADETSLPHAGIRLFTDSAPVLEKALAEKAGLGWIGKNTLLLNQAAGSWFFLGEILTPLALPITDKVSVNRCGSCSACMDICPTRAIVAPYQLDARRCISYLTIENKGAIPVEFRTAMGNRVFGCDDCQVVCPWNRYAAYTAETDFLPRHQLDSATLLDLFAWTQSEYLDQTAGSPLRRPGYSGWQRNLAVALGNAPGSHAIQTALKTRLPFANDMVGEHIRWALKAQEEKLAEAALTAGRTA